MPISHTKDTPGPVARSVRDIALLDAVITDSPASLPRADADSIALGVPRGHFHDDLDADVAAAMDAAPSALSGAGFRLIDVDLGSYGSQSAACGGVIARHEIRQDLPAWLSAHAPGTSLDDLRSAIASPDVAAILADGPVPEPEYRHARDTVRARMWRLYRDAFAAHGIDAIVFPTTPLTARPIADAANVDLNGKRVPGFPTYIRNTDPASNIGAPGISLPVRTDWLPVGLELDALPGRDRHLLAIAAAVEPVI